MQFKSALLLKESNIKKNIRINVDKKNRDKMN